MPEKAFTSRVIWEDGWNAFTIEGEGSSPNPDVVLEVTTILGRNRINYFMASSFSRECILLPKRHFEEAMFALARYDFDISEF